MSTLLSAGRNKAQTLGVSQRRPLLFISNWLLQSRSLWVVPLMLSGLGIQAAGQGICHLVPTSLTVHGDQVVDGKEGVTAGGTLTATVTVESACNGISSGLKIGTNPPILTQGGKCALAGSQDFFLGNGQTSATFSFPVSANLVSNNTTVTVSVFDPDRPQQHAQATIPLFPGLVSLVALTPQIEGGEGRDPNLTLFTRSEGVAQIVSANPSVASFNGKPQVNFQVPPVPPGQLLSSFFPGPVQVNEVTAVTTVDLKATFRPCTTDINSKDAPTLTDTLHLTVLPEPIIHRMRLKINNLDGTPLRQIGLRLVENFNGATAFELDAGQYVGLSGGGGGGVPHVDQLTLDQQRYKLGQGWGIQIVPLQDDGSEGKPLFLFETISAVNDQSDQTPANSSTIFSSFTELFAGQVLVHFPLAARNPSPQFFPVHSGTSTLILNFTNIRDLTLNIPVLITTCTGSNSSCTPQLGSSHPEFDELLMKFADRNGIPPQLLKAQIQQESSFVRTAFRYEPVSKDWKEYNSSGSVTVPTALTPWLLAQSRTCSTDLTTPGNIPAGNSIVLNGPDVNSRERIYGVFAANGNPLCRVMQIPANPNARGIRSTDAALSMENILYTNDGCFFRSICAGWATINARSFDRFTDFQVDHPPFTGQTVVASSYGLHQLMYETAVGMGYQNNGAGLSPGLLFEASTSLDLGTEYLAQLYMARGSPQATDFDDVNTFVFQFGPSLRTFNGPPRLSFGQIFSTCGATAYVADPVNPSPYDYPCLILKRYGSFVPSPLGVN